MLRGKAAAKPDPSGIYIARTSYSAGDRRVIRKGMRLRGDDSRVREHPAMWVVADGLTDDELAAVIFDANRAAAEART
jgi:hypothetical protein